MNSGSIRLACDFLILEPSYYTFCIFEHMRYIEVFGFNVFSGNLKSAYYIFEQQLTPIVNLQCYLPHEWFPSYYFMRDVGHHTINHPSIVQSRTSILNTYSTHYTLPQLQDTTDWYKLHKVKLISIVMKMKPVLQLR